MVGLSPKHKSKSWTKEEVFKSAKDHIVFTWAASNPGLSNAIAWQKGEGVYLYDFDGKKYLDLTSQAINNNLGYTIPQQILDSITKQLQTLTMVYGGTSITEPRAKLAQLFNDITPQEITGFLFPLTGAEANEVAIRIARQYTGKSKILSKQRSYHGGSSGSLSATGDFRRFFAEDNTTGFIKFFDYESFTFKWGNTEEEAIKNYLNYVEELIIYENPNNIAAMIMETITGANGILINPQEVMLGLRALCYKYNILLILDEVMAGMGRTGAIFGFQTYDGLVPDIFTTAKGLTASFLPMSQIAVSSDIQEHFKTNMLGWGSTFQAHPVSCVCAYESIQYVIQNNIPQHVKEMEKIMVKRMDQLLQNHKNIKQARVRGLFGALDLADNDGRPLSGLNLPPPPEIGQLKQELLKRGVLAWIRSPYMHICPPLIITSEELNFAFDALDDAFGVVFK